MRGVPCETTTSRRFGVRLQSTSTDLEWEVHAMVCKCFWRVSKVKGTFGQTGLRITKFSLRVCGYLLCVPIMMGHGKRPWWAFGKESILIAGSGKVVDADYSTVMGMSSLATWWGVLLFVVTIWTADRVVEMVTVDILPRCGVELRSR